MRTIFYPCDTTVVIHKSTGLFWIDSWIVRGGGPQRDRLLSPPAMAQQVDARRRELFRSWSRIRHTCRGGCIQADAIVLAVVRLHHLRDHLRGPHRVRALSNL